MFSLTIFFLLKKEIIWKSVFTGIKSKFVVLTNLITFYIRPCIINRFCRRHGIHTNLLLFINGMNGFRHRYFITQFLPTPDRDCTKSAAVSHLGIIIFFKFINIKTIPASMVLLNFT